MVLTEPGLGGIVFAVREGRIGFRRLLTYTFNMLTKKIEIVLFLAIGLVLTGQAGDDAGDDGTDAGDERRSRHVADHRSRKRRRDRPANGTCATSPSAAIVLGACKLGFSTAMLCGRKISARTRSDGVANVRVRRRVLFGSQGLIYVLRERRHMWSSMPSKWVFASSAIDIGIVAAACTIRDLDGAAAVAARAGDLRRRGGIRIDPRSDQAAGNRRIQGRVAQHSLVTRSPRE